MLWTDAACLFKSIRSISFRWMTNRGGNGPRRRLRACFKIRRGPVFAEKAGWLGAPNEHTRPWSVSEKQRRQPAFSAKTRRAAALLAGAGVAEAGTARGGDAPASAPWPQPKSLAAGPRPILKQALSFTAILILAPDVDRDTSGVPALAGRASANPHWVDCLTRRRLKAGLHTFQNENR